MTAADDAGNTGDASVTPAALHDRLRAGVPVSILDVRDRDEHETWRIEGPGVEAVQVPYVDFLQAQVRGTVADRFAETGLAEPVIVVCARGESSDYVADLLRSAGVEAANLAGGMDAWADLSVATDLPVDGPRVVQYDRPSSGCLSYLVVSDGVAAVVDPLLAFADRYVADAQAAGADLRYAVDTHVHADHVSGVRRVAGLADATAVLPAGARDRRLAFEPDRLLADGDVVTVGDAGLEAVHAPGHTTELTALALRDGAAGVPAASSGAPSVVFTGDALFLDAVGRPDLERGTEGARDLAARLHETLTGTLFAFPGEVLVAPGHHGPSATPEATGAFAAPLGTVRDRLDWIGSDREAFVESILADAPPRPANYEAIIQVNLGRESIEAADAAELELGPNNCAVSGAGAAD